MTVNTNDTMGSDVASVSDNGVNTGPTPTLQSPRPARTKDERRRLRETRKNAKINGGEVNVSAADDNGDDRFTTLLANDEDKLLEFVAKVNKVYEQKLHKNAPFMTFVLCGMQSSGKSTIMERFMNAVLNIVQEGTGTRCPLDTTCIHDDKLSAAECSLHGDELEGGGDNLSVTRVFDLIVRHNKMLAGEDRFSTKPLRLVYRSKGVQNMRFVDTPGIISNQGTGKDNREDIKEIIRSELRRPNTKLCVLLEAAEFDKNPIVDFLDLSLEGRDAWIHNATFLMTKFDKQADDARTASKANNFFRKFHDNQIFPHLVITNTLAKEDLPAEELYKAREELLSASDGYEKGRFETWRKAHASFRQESGDTEVLDQQSASRLGFIVAKREMRHIMLQDTAKRLPEVLSELRRELEGKEKEKKRLEDMMKFSNPAELKFVVSQLLSEVDDKLQRYLDGDLESCRKFPGMMQTLEEELEEEEDSEWSAKDLNHYTDGEDAWRDRIIDMDCQYPEEVQPDTKFLGGKQYHRAVDFFNAVMVDALPDPYELENLVPNLTGYLGGSLQRENWERATVEIVRVCLKDITHPGVNFLVKHVGNIFRRMFQIAIDDVRQGERFSDTFKLLPRGIENYLTQRFEDFLWELMRKAAEMTHLSLEPMYSTVNPNLPTFQARDLEDNLDDDSALEKLMDRVKTKFKAMVSGSNSEAKAYLKNENRSRALVKKKFLPDERTSMITQDESKKILQRSFEYIVALMQFNVISLRFQLDHFLFLEFKNKMKKSFVYELLNTTEWEELVGGDDNMKDDLKVVEDQIKSLRESLMEVQHLSRYF
ncbi:MAG: hypothetical protein SGARI_000308 [Bacillariaceae sp.]